MATFRKHVANDGEVKYTAVIRKKGRPTECATFKSLTKAREWARNTESDIDQGRRFVSVESKKHTLKELISRYVDTQKFNAKKNAAAQKKQLAWWQENLGSFFLSEIDAPRIAEYRDKLAKGITKRFDKKPPKEGEERKRTTRSAATVARYMAALSACLKYGMKECYWLPDNPMRQVDKPVEPKGRTRFLSDDERARLLKACKESQDHFLYGIVVLAMSSGLRMNEILSLTWRDVDFNRSLISVLDSKNKESRGVPLAGHAFDVLKDLSKVRRLDTNLCFPAPAVPGRPPRPIDFRSAWRRARKAAKLEDFRFHDLRHCCATYLAVSGATLAELAGVLGHKTLQCVKRYQHLTAEHVSPIVAKMNSEIFATKAEESETAEQE